MKVRLVYFGVEVEGNRCEGCGRLFLLKPKATWAKTCGRRRCADVRMERQRRTEIPARSTGEADRAGTDR